MCSAPSPSWPIYPPFLFVSLPCCYTESVVLKKKNNVSQREIRTWLTSLFPSQTCSISSFTLSSFFTSLFYYISVLLFICLFLYSTAFFCHCSLPYLHSFLSSSAAHLTVWNMTSHFGWNPWNLCCFCKWTHRHRHGRGQTNTCAFCTNLKCYFQLLQSWKKTGPYWDEAWGLGGDNVGMIVCSASLLLPETQQKLKPTSGYS